MQVRVMVPVALSVAFATTSAFSQEFGKSGDFSIAVERVFAIHKSKVYEENWVAGEPDWEDSYTGISFGWRGPSAISRAGRPQASSNPLDVPRFSFDYFILEHLSLGGSLGYSSISDADDSQEGFSEDSTSSFLFNPRVGYALMFSSAVGFWPQGGLSYYSITHDETHSESGLTLTINLPFVLSPATHLAFMAGPYLDLGMLGTIDYDGGFGGDPPPPDHDRTYRSIGLQFGLMGWL